MFGSALWRQHGERRIPSGAALRDDRACVCVELLEQNLGKYSAVGGAATAWRRRRAAALGGGRGEHAEAVCKSIGNLAF